MQNSVIKILFLSVKMWIKSLKKRYGTVFVINSRDKSETSFLHEVYI